MRILPPKATLNDDHLTLTAQVACQGRTDECFFSVPREYADFVDPASANCFLAGLLYPALRYGETIQVEGKVSARLIFNLNEYVIPLLTACDPRLKPVRITAQETDAHGYPEAQYVTTGFSGGIDSFHTIYDHYELPTPDGFRLTHLLSFNVGAHGIPKSAADLPALERKFHARYRKLKPCADELGLPFITVNSNLHLFHPWGHLETHTLANISAVLFLQRATRRYYLASAGHPYDHLWRYLGNHGRLDDIALLNSLLLPWMSTETCDLLEDGPQYDRSQKTARVADYPPVAKYLNVCGNYDTLDTNCSACDKCCRTMLTLELLGKLDQFSQVFDLDKYRRETRRLYIAQTILREESSLFSKHLMDLARAKRIDLRHEVNCLDLLRAKMLDGRLHQFIRRHPTLKKLAKTFF